VGDKTFDLLAGGFAESLGAAEIDGVGLDQVGIELIGVFLAACLAVVAWFFKTGYKIKK